MRDALGESLKKLKWIKVRKNRMVPVLLLLSLLVVLDVFWTMRQPGLALAGDAAKQMVVVRCGLSHGIPPVDRFWISYHETRGRGWVIMDKISSNFPTFR